MLIIGCDYHPAFQQIAFVDTATGECGERRVDGTDDVTKIVVMQRTSYCWPTRDLRSAANESLLHGIPVIPAGEKIEVQFSRCSNCSSFEYLIEQLANGAMRFADGCAMIRRAG